MAQDMQMMKEKMDMMINAMRRWVSTNLDELVQRTYSPFTAQVTSFPLPTKFRMLQVEVYDGSQDPIDHLESFKTLMHLQGVPNEIMCRVFPITLKGLARLWFNKLTPNTVSTFKKLSGHFVTHFIGGQRYKRSSANLLNGKRKAWDHMWLDSIRWPFWLKRPTTKFWSPHSPTDSSQENSFFHL